MNLTLALTTYNRYEMTIEAIASILEDKRISEIVIIDDCSTDGSLSKLKFHLDKYDHVKIIGQTQNRGMAENKRDAIFYSDNDWVIIFDSDNIIRPDYIDALEQCFYVLSKNENLIFCPDFAMPTFDYRKYGGKLITKENIKNVVADPMGNCLLNTCNMCVNRSFYLLTYRTNAEAGSADSVWHNLQHIKNGGVFFVVPGMQYFHRQHAGSGFLLGLDYNMKMANQFRKELLEL